MSLMVKAGFIIQWMFEYYKYYMFEYYNSLTISIFPQGSP